MAHPRLVNTAYGISWLYIAGDVVYEGWRARLKQQGLYHPGLRPWDLVPQVPEEQRLAAAEGARDWRLVSIERAVFQSIATMGLPAFTIHSTIRYSGRLFKNAKNPQIKTFGPVALGLAVVPVLPYLFDKPVENAVDIVFRKIEDLISKK